MSPFKVLFARDNKRLLRIARRLSMMVALFQMVPTCFGQGITNMTSWTPHNDPFAKNGSGESIESSASVVGLPNTRATVTMSCNRTDLQHVKWPPALDIHVALTGSALDVEVEHSSRCITTDTWSGACLTVQPTTSTTTRIKTRFEQEQPGFMTLSISDVHRFSYSVGMTPSPKEPGYYFGDYIVGFPSNGTDVTLKISQKSPQVANFLRSCIKTAARELEAEKLRESKEREAVRRMAAAEASKRAADEKAAAEAAAEHRAVVERPLRELLKYVGLPQTPIPPKRDTEKYAPLTLYTLNAFDAYRWDADRSKGAQVEPSVGANAGIDESIFNREKIAITDKIQVRAATQCVVPVDVPSAVVVDGKQLVMAKCSDPNHKWPAPEINVLIPRDVGFTLSLDEADASLAKPFADYIGKPWKDCYLVTGTSSNVHYVRAQPIRTTTAYTKLPASAENHASEGPSAISKKKILIDGKKQPEWLNIASNTALLIDPLDYVPSGTSDKQYVKAYWGTTQGVSLTSIAQPAVYVNSESVECRPWPK